MVGFLRAGLEAAQNGLNARDEAFSRPVISAPVACGVAAFLTWASPQFFTQLFGAQLAVATMIDDLIVTYIRDFTQPHGFVETATLELKRALFAIPINFLIHGAFCFAAGATMSVGAIFVASLLAYLMSRIVYAFLDFLYRIEENKQISFDRFLR
ncbi:MAG TPA: hypothetical protein VN457_03350 [Chlamydiales bacterium]|nr:hypothetical protein [Chlamydiales bacterium]